MDAKPRDVFVAGCQAIAQAFVEDGFKATKKGQLLHRQRGAFREEIYFQSSHYNGPGRVAVVPSGTIDSEAFGRWRGENGLESGTRVAGVNIGHLDGTGWARWDIGDPNARAVTLASIETAIRTHLLPWFDLIENPMAVGSAPGAAKVAGFFDIESQTEYLVFVGRESEAQARLARFVKELPTLSVSYRLVLQQLVDRYRFDLSLPPAVDPSRSWRARLVGRLRGMALANPNVPRNLGGVEQRTAFEPEEE